MASNDVEVLDPATSVEKLRETESGVALDRRYFLTALGVAGAAAGVMVGSGLLSSGPTALAQQPKPSGYAQLDVMNFLMNIQYLKATLYAFLTTGLDIPANYPTPNPTGAGTSGTVVATPSSPIYGSGQIYNQLGKVTFPNQQITDLFNEMYYDEVSQLIDLRNLIGDASGDVVVGARPTMDLLGTGNKATATATMTYQQAIGYARMLEDLSVSAFIGASVYLTGANLAYVSQILASNGYHAGALRLISIQNSIPYIGTSFLTTTATGTQSLNTYTGSVTTGSNVIVITPVTTNAPIIGNLITGIGVPPGSVITGYAPAANSTFTGIANNAASPNNPNVLTAVSSVSGLAVGQPISGTDIATGAYITGIGTTTVTMSAAATGTATVAPTGYTTSGSPSITGVSSISGIVAGQTISGTGIPSTATVASATGTTIVISPSSGATATSQLTTSGILTSGSTTITSVSSLSGINTGQPITGTGVPSGTTVSATGTNTITMSKAATATTTQTPTTFTGTQVTGSAVILNVSSFTSLAVGQPVTGTNIQPGTTITNLNTTGKALTLSIAPAGTALQPLTPTGILTPSTSVITGVSSTAGVLPGQPITGTGIPANTVVTSTTATTINIGILVSGIVTNGSSTVTSLTTTTGSAATTGLVVGQTITGNNIPANTTITAINTTALTLTLSNSATGSSVTPELLSVGVLATDTIQGIVVAGDPVVASGPTVPLNSIAGLAAGQTISGTGIPAGTVISSVGTGTLTMSNPATVSSFVAETLIISVPTPVSLTISVLVPAISMTATTTQTLTIPSTVTLKIPTTVTVTVGKGTLTISQPAVASGVQTLTMITGDLMDVEPYDPGTAALAAAGPSPITIPVSTYPTSGPTIPLVYQGFFNTASTGTATANTPAGLAFVRSFGQTLSVLLGSTQTNPITYQGGFFPVGVSGPINANNDQ